MILTSFAASTRAHAVRYLSKTICALLIGGMLAVSNPAASDLFARGAYDVPGAIDSIDLSRLLPGDMEFPAFGVAPVAKAANSSLEFLRDAKTVLLPSVPAGLENAKLPTFGERTKAIFANTLGREGSSARTDTSSISSRLYGSSAVEPSSASPRLGGVNATPPQPSSVVDFDFDNDGKADVGRWHTANTEFKVRNSNGGSYSAFTVGSSSSIAAPGDFNGDGKTDAAVFNAGTWKYKTSTGATEQTINFGTTGDIPVAGDYDGDGTTDAAVYRPSTNTWWINKSTGGTTNTTFGASGDIVAPGDYDGDGKNDLALYRPQDGDWHITPSSTGTAYSFHWGISSDTPVP